MKQISLWIMITMFAFFAPRTFAADAEGAAPSIQFDDFKTHVEGTQFSVNMPFKGDFSTAELNASYLGDSVQIDIPGAVFPKGKHLLRTNGKVVKSVYVTQPDENTVRVRVTLNQGFSASELSKSLSITRNDGAFNMSFNASIEKNVVAKAGETETPTQKIAFDDAAAVNPVAKEIVRDEIIEQARLVARDVETPTTIAKTSIPNADAAVLGTDTAVAAAVAAARDARSEKTALPDDTKSDAKTADASKAAAVETSKKLSENEIPLTAEKETKKSETAPWQRIILTLGVMTVMGVGASIGMKKWSQSARGKVAKNARIKVITQHHLGPKKQLMIVEVAGEAMLIGVTDHNISMLKGLSLIDDEIPEALPHSFAGAIEENFIETQNQAQPRLPTAQTAAQIKADEEADNFALHGLSEIRDKVSTRLKNMRPL